MEQLKNIKATLTLFMDGDKILLGEKKRGFAKGTLNGIGGKQDPGETIEQAMIRECQEEIGVTPTDYEQVGKIDFETWYKGEHAIMEMFIYNCYAFSGQIIETDEIRPAWFNKNQVPFDRMLDDDKLWLPQVLQGYKVKGNVKFDKDMKMLHNDIKCIPHRKKEQNDYSIKSN